MAQNRLLLKCHIFLSLIARISEGRRRSCGCPGCRSLRVEWACPALDELYPDGHTGHARWDVGRSDLL